MILLYVFYTFSIIFLSRKKIKKSLLSFVMFTMLFFVGGVKARWDGGLKQSIRKKVGDIRKKVGDIRKKVGDIRKVIFKYSYCIIRNT